jgi:tetratricopeptide (TPR) repeat protein
MQFPQANQLFLQGLALHQQGQLVQALALYQAALKIQPKHFDALHLSGVVASQSKKHKNENVTQSQISIGLFPNGIGDCTND